MSISAIYSSSTAAAPVATSTVSARAQPADGSRAAIGANAVAGISSTNTGLQLDAKALALISKLKARDTDVRQHEQAHLAAAGGLATSGPSYTYERGPNGVSYAVGGEVQIDTSPGRTPEQTIARAHIIEAAALAPADPSGADRAVAVQAEQLEAQARAELAQDQSQGAAGDAASSVNRAYGAQPAAAPTLDTYA